MADKYDRLYAACVTPFKPGQEEVDEAALHNFMRYFMQPKFVDAGGGIIINPEAGEVFYLSREEMRRNIRRHLCPRGCDSHQCDENNEAESVRKILGPLQRLHIPSEECE